MCESICLGICGIYKNHTATSNWLNWTASSAYFNNNLIWKCKLGASERRAPLTVFVCFYVYDWWPFISSEFLVSVCYYYLLFVIIKRVRQTKEKEKGINVGYYKWCKWRVIDCVCVCVCGIMLGKLSTRQGKGWFIKVIHGDLLVIIAIFSTYARCFYLFRKNMVQNWVYFSGISVKNERL